MKLVSWAFTLIFLVSCGIQKQTSRKAERLKPQSALLQSDTVFYDLYHLPDLVKNYELELEQLDKTKLSSGGLAIELYLKMFKGKDPKICDIGLLSVYSFFARVYNQHLDSEIEPFKDQKAQKKFNTTIKKYGFRLYTYEDGSVDLVTDPSEINRRAFSYFTKDMQRYLTRLKRESKHSVYSPSGLAIPPKKLVERVIWWETFNDEINRFVLEDDVDASSLFYTDLLIKGAGTTCVLSNTTHSINPYFTEAYTYLIRKYPASYSASLIKTYYEAILLKDFEFIKEFQTSYGIPSSDH